MTAKHDGKWSWLYLTIEFIGKNASWILTGIFLLLMIFSAILGNTELLLLGLAGIVITIIIEKLAEKIIKITRPAIESLWRCSHCGAQNAGGNKCTRCGYPKSFTDSGFTNHNL